jgi:hypothetical protein
MGPAIFDYNKRLILLSNYITLVWKSSLDSNQKSFFRRKGLVPLSSLCKDASTVLPTNVKFITGRNVRLGKPGLYVKDSGRILAIGGSREKPVNPIYPYITPVHSFKVVKVPQLVKKPDEDFQVWAKCSSECFRVKWKSIVKLYRKSRSDYTLRSGGKE